MPSWHQVRTWTGQGIKNTESFEIRGREWRINWKATNNSQFGGIMQIMVYDSSGGLASLAANHEGAGGDTSYVRGRPGQYYLEINSFGVDWQVAVEDQY